MGGQEDAFGIEPDFSGIFRGGTKGIERREDWGGASVGRRH